MLNSFSGCNNHTTAPCTNSRTAYQEICECPDHRSRAESVRGLLRRAAAAPAYRGLHRAGPLPPLHWSHPRRGR